MAAAEFCNSAPSATAARTLSSTYTRYDATAPTLRFVSRVRPEAAASPRPAAVTTPPKTAPLPPSTRETATLAFTTRMRRGSWVNVVITLRWLHSPVNSRIATTGRRSDSPRAATRR